MEILKISIKDIIPYANNAKIHTPEQISQIKSSIKEFGFNDPIAIDENNVIIEGHGRFVALQEMGYTEVPIIRLSHLTEIQKKQYILAHNKLNMNTGFDEEMLKLEMESLEMEDALLELTGFSDKELEDLLGEDIPMEADEILDIEDDSEEVKRDGLICPCCQHQDLKKNFLEVELNGEDC